MHSRDASDNETNRHFAVAPGDNRIGDGRLSGRDGVSPVA